MSQPESFHRMIMDNVWIFNGGWLIWVMVYWAAQWSLKVEKDNVDAATDALANNFTDALANKLDVSITNRLSI